MNDRNSNSSTRKIEHDREHQHDRQIAERLLLLPVRPAVLDADRRRQLQVGDRLLHGGDARCPCRRLRAAPSLRRAAAGSRGASSVWPGSSSIVVERSQRRGRPGRADEHRVAHRLERRARRRAGTARAPDTGRSLTSTGRRRRLASTIATVTVPSSSGVNPARSAASGLTVKRTAGPLVVFSMPSSTSTTGVAAADLHLAERVGHLRRPRAQQFGSGENSLTTTGSGAPVRSPIMSCST